MGQNKYKYVGIHRIFAKLLRDYGVTFDEGDVIEWIGEALEAIGSVPFYEEAVAFMEVKNHQVVLPNGLHQVTQFARNMCWKGPEDAVCPADVLCDIKDTLQNCKTCDINPTNTLPIPLDCNGSPMMDYEIAYYRPYYDLQAEYYGWGWQGSGLHQRCFTPIRLVTNNFYMGMDKPSDPNSTAIYNGAGYDEYTIIRNTVARFSFKEGQVALSYTRQVVDEETGYPMVPDSYSHTTAIINYIIYKMMAREYYAGREGAGGRLQKAEADWQFYCKQASNMDLMVYGVDEHQNWLDARQRLLPNNKQYFGFFGKMARPEGRKFDDPDFRNYSVSYFRGVGGNANF